MNILGWLRKPRKASGQTELLRARSAKLASIEQIRKRRLLPGELNPNRELYGFMSHDTDPAVRIAAVKALIPIAQTLCAFLIEEEHPDVHDAILDLILTDSSARVATDKLGAVFALEDAKRSTQRKGHERAIRALNRKIDNICRLLNPGGK
jgi:hypothetical protein